MSSIADLDLDVVFSALASAPRRDIVRHLATGPRTTPEIGRRFEFTKQALNRHIVALETAGLIERHRTGRVDTVALAPVRLTSVADWAHDIRAAWEQNLDRLSTVLGEQHPPPTESEPRR